MSKKIVFYIATFILSLVFATAAQAEEIDGVDYEVSKPLQSDLQLVQSSPVTFATLSYKNGFFDNHADAYTVSGGDKASTAVNNKLGENSTGAFSFANRATLTINLNDYYDFDGFFIEFASARGLSGESEITSTISDRLIVQFYLDNKVVQTIETDKLIGNTRYSSKNYSLSNTTKANKVTVKSENSAILYTFIREIELYEPEKIYLAVTDLKVSNITTDSAVVSWTIPTDEDIKNVKLNGDDVGLVTSKKIEGLKSETSYTATVETVYKDGTTIKAVINYKTLATPKPPSDVSSLSATKTHEQVKLSWSSTEKEEDVEYVIYRKKNSASLFSLFASVDGTKIGTTDSKTYVDATVKPETKYTYTVTTLNKENALESDGKSVEVTTDAEPVITEPPLNPTEPEKKDDDWVISWTQPTTGKIKVLIGGKEYTTVNASALKVVIPDKDMSFNIWGNPDVQLIHVTEDGIELPPVAPPAGDGGEGSVDAGILGNVSLGSELTPIKLLKAGVALLGVVGLILLLRLSFIIAPTLIKLIKDSFRKGASKNDKHSI